MLPESVLSGVLDCSVDDSADVTLADSIFASQILLRNQLSFIAVFHFGTLLRSQLVPWGTTRKVMPPCFAVAHAIDNCSIYSVSTGDVGHCDRARSKQGFDVSDFCSGQSTASLCSSWVSRMPPALINGSIFSVFFGGSQSKMRWIDTCAVGEISGWIQASTRMQDPPGRGLAVDHLPTHMVSENDLAISTECSVSLFRSIALPQPTLGSDRAHDHRIEEFRRTVVCCYAVHGAGMTAILSLLLLKPSTAFVVLAVTYLLIPDHLAGAV